MFRQNETKYWEIEFDENLAPRMVLECIFILMVTVAAFGQ
jgi:hypothetical protein